MQSNAIWMAVKIKWKRIADLWEEKKIRSNVTVNETKKVLNNKWGKQSNNNSIDQRALSLF